VTTSVNDSLVRDALSQVIDPEAGMNIVDLGLVYSIEVGDAGVHVQMTMTSAACPMADMIVDDAHAALEAALPRNTPVEIEMVWDPPWTPERMSSLAREQFGWARR
jgi:metal-sulfur cluster biosynthetic enzyme